ncbi:cobalamin B12-binding domain-containing protein [Chloroflexota bacterium]
MKSFVSKKRPLRVLLTKLGLDAHDRGVINVGMALRDVGIEVIHLGLHQMPEQIVQAALQEDVDIIGISSMADAHNALVPRVLKLLKEKGAGEIPVILGGFIQPEDIPRLKEAGVTEVFQIGAQLDAVVDWIQKFGEERAKNVPRTGI